MSRKVIKFKKLQKVVVKDNGLIIKELVYYMEFMA